MNIRYGILSQDCDDMKRISFWTSAQNLMNAIEQNATDVIKRIAESAPAPKDDSFIYALSQPTVTKDTIRFVITIFDLDTTYLLQSLADHFGSWSYMPFIFMRTLVELGAKWPYATSPAIPPYILKINKAKSTCVALLWARQCNKQLMLLDLMKEIVEEIYDGRFE